jgi:hypothetical protein
MKKPPAEKILDRQLLTLPIYYHDNTDSHHYHEFQNPPEFCHQKLLPVIRRIQKEYSLII